MSKAHRCVPVVLGVSSCNFSFCLSFSSFDSFMCNEQHEFGIAGVQGLGVSLDTPIFN